MQYLDLSWPTPEENLAADEALLDAAEAGERGETLRFWQAPSPFIVVGHSNRLHQEVNVSACTALRVPILRRCSGGGTVLQGPGCLNYALVLRINAHPELATVNRTNRFIMSRHATILTALLGRTIHQDGTTDLVMDHRKISGNAQRRRRTFLLFHGTLLLAPNLPLMERLLPLPSRKPAYRGNRSHTDFLGSIPAQADQLKEAWRQAWTALTYETQIDTFRVHSLVRNRYSLVSWNHKF